MRDLFTIQPFFIFLSVAMLSAASVLAFSRLRRVHQQFLRSSTSLTQAIGGVAAAVEEHTHITSDQRRLAAADLIVRLETDAEWLRARQNFAMLRESSTGEYNQYLLLLEKRKRIKDEIITEVKNKKSLFEIKYSHIGRDLYSIEAGGRPLDREYIFIEDRYQLFINYMNMLENMSIQIQRGVYDEETLRMWHRGAYIRNVIAALPAVDKMREVNSAVFRECVLLARAWGRTDAEFTALGGEEVCRRDRERLNEMLAAQNIPPVDPFEH